MAGEPGLGAGGRRSDPERHLRRNLHLATIARVLKGEDEEEEEDEGEIIREHFEVNRKRFERTNRLLQERIAYHRRKLEEERAARGEA